MYPARCRLDQALSIVCVFLKYFSPETVVLFSPLFIIIVSVHPVLHLGSGDRRLVLSPLLKVDRYNRRLATVDHIE